MLERVIKQLNQVRSAKNKLRRAENELVEAIRDYIPRVLRSRLDAQECDEIGELVTEEIFIALTSKDVRSSVGGLMSSICHNNVNSYLSSAIQNRTRELPLEAEQPSGEKDGGSEQRETVPVEDYAKSIAANQGLSLAYQVLGLAEQPENRLTKQDKSRLRALKKKTRKSEEEKTEFNTLNNKLTGVALTDEEFGLLVFFKSYYSWESQHDKAATFIRDSEKGDPVLDQTELAEMLMLPKQTLSERLKSLRKKLQVLEEQLRSMKADTVPSPDLPLDGESGPQDAPTDPSSV